ncbi:putative transcription factor interactor and regulator CCHC(Zn) family [Helianthus annuus]|nr:putative transcription factor interactor and regulator CCHC(Zn) family [Helianthus annuus]
MSSSDSDSVDNINCFSTYAESVTVEEQSAVDDEPHSIVADVADDSDAAKPDHYAWNCVMSWYAESRGIPIKTDDSGAVVLDYDRDENALTGKSDVLSDKFETPVSSDSEISSADLGNYSSVPETSTDTSETYKQDKDDKIDMFNCVSKEIDEQGSSDEPDIQVADSGMSDNERSASRNFECDKHSEPSSATPEESQTVSNIDCSSSVKPESADVRNSEVDEAEEEIFVETNSEETYEISEPEEKGSTETNSTVDSTDETEEEISVETNSAEPPESTVSEEKESVEVNSTNDSTLDPKGSDSEESISNKAKSTESAPLKKRRSRKNRRPRKKNVRKENPTLKQTEPKLKGKAVDTCSCADNCKQGSSKTKHKHKQSTSKEKKRLDKFPGITQAELNVFFSKRQTCFNCGIPGHIARNCVHRPYYSRNMYHQKAMPSHFTKNGPPKAKPSDRDWNLAKQENKNFSNINRFQRKTKVFPTNESVSDTRNWKPKTPVGSQSPCSQPSTSTPSPKTTGDVKSHMIFRLVSYTDSDGQLRSTMAWVPVSN